MRVLSQVCYRIRNVVPGKRAYQAAKSSKSVRFAVRVAEPE
jgi:hypothetical protein